MLIVIVQLRGDTDCSPRETKISMNGELAYHSYVMKNYSLFICSPS